MNDPGLTTTYNRVTITLIIVEETESFLQAILETLNHLNKEDKLAFVNQPIDARRRTFLYIAAQDGCVNIVNKLLEAGADPKAKTNDGTTPLYIACTGHLDIVKALLEAGADPTAKTDHGVTPLYIAAYYGHLDIVKALLEAGADLTASTNADIAPLDIAACFGHFEVVKMLLKAGAGINQRLLINLPIEEFDSSEYILINTKRHDTNITNQTHPNAITTIAAYHKHVYGMMSDANTPFLYLVTHVFHLLALYQPNHTEEKKQLLEALHKKVQRLNIKEVKSTILFLNCRISQELDDCTETIINALRVHSLSLTILTQFILPHSLKNSFFIPQEIEENLDPIKTAFEANIDFWKARYKGNTSSEPHFTKKNIQK